MKKIIIISTIISLLSTTVAAEPTVNIETKYYSIYGSSANELREAMNTKSPVRQSGNTYDAYTSWYVNWRFNWDSYNGECYMTKVTTTVDVEFTLPQWINRNEANSSLKEHWDNYYSALIDHENGHKDFGINAAREIESKLLTLSSKRCSSLEKKANSLGTSIINKYATKEKRYDRTTNHGMNEGAVFP